MDRSFNPDVEWYAGSPEYSMPARGNATEAEIADPSLIDDTAHTVIDGMVDELSHFGDDELALMQPETRERIKRVMNAAGPPVLDFAHTQPLKPKGA